MSLKGQIHTKNMTYEHIRSLTVDIETAFIFFYFFLLSYSCVKLSIDFTNVSPTRKQFWYASPQAPKQIRIVPLRLTSFTFTYSTYPDCVAICTLYIVMRCICIFPILTAFFSSTIYILELSSFNFYLQYALSNRLVWVGPNWDKTPGGGTALVILESIVHFDVVGHAL